MEAVFKSSKAAVRVFGPLATESVHISGIDVWNDDRWALIGASYNYREILDVRQCFNDTAFLFALGNNLSAGRMELSFLVFLSEPGCSPGGEFKAIKDAIESYRSERVSNKLSHIEVTIGSCTVSGWLDSMAAGNFDADRGVCVVSFSFLARLD